MTTGNIDRKARVWTVTLGPNGELRAELDPRRAAALAAKAKLVA